MKKIFVVKETIDDYDFMTREGELIEYPKGYYSTRELAREAIIKFCEAYNEYVDDENSKLLQRNPEKEVWMDGDEMQKLFIEELVLDKEI